MTKVGFAEGIDPSEINKNFPKKDVKYMGKNRNQGKDYKLYSRSALTEIETIPKRNHYASTNSEYYVDKAFDKSSLSEAQKKNISNLDILNPHQYAPKAKSAKSTFKRGKKYKILDGHKKSDELTKFGEMMDGLGNSTEDVRYIKNNGTHKKAFYNSIKNTEIVDMMKGTNGKKLSLDKINKRWNDDDKWREIKDKWENKIKDDKTNQDKDKTR